MATIILTRPDRPHQSVLQTFHPLVVTQEQKKVECLAVLLGYMATLLDYII